VFGGGGGAFVNKTPAGAPAAPGGAALQGRAYVVPDDVKSVAAPVLAHRIALGAEARMRRQDATSVIQAVLDEEPVPVEGA
ncbi:MAG: AAA family ATPase, partial [Clostridia bacterium]|nr:AAA family ATPase [Clostridia bacterium]